MVVDIGLEVHAALLTKSKMFCSCPTDFGARPNENCCPVCLGLPGTLPALNEAVPRLAVRAGLALGCKISRVTSFDRKNYFYPDLPRGYQISQFYQPVCTDGALAVDTAKGTVSVPIRELHMEDDAGKLIRRDGVVYADYNRCGVPLIEIVTEPVLHGPEEAAAFLRELIGVLDYTSVCDCRMQEGSLRVDVNLSVRENENARLGIRTEMKNLGSIRAVSRAIEYEAGRQAKAIAAGNTVRQETRRWDEDRSVTVTLRRKAGAEDYRYFPEPDIPPIYIGGELINGERDRIPELPRARRSRYMDKMGISLQESRTLTADMEISDFFDAAVLSGAEPGEAAKWICSDLMRIWKGRDRGKLTPERLAELIAMVKKGKVSRATAREMLAPLHDSAEGPGEYAERHGLGQIGGKEAVEAAVSAVLAENRDKVLEYKAGKKKLRAYLFGEAMRRLEGRGDPLTISIVLGEYLDKN